MIGAPVAMVMSSSLGRNLKFKTAANFYLPDLPGGVVVTPVNLVAADDTVTRGLHYTDPSRRARTAVHMMHPRTDQSQNYVIPSLIAAGFDVLARSGRWPNNDVATVHETLLLDVASGVGFLRDRGYDNVVLLGNSGGGTLACLYQQQALLAPPDRLTDTPAGDPCDLNAVPMSAADGLVMLGGHLGEGVLLRKWIDPAVVDEADPVATEPALDMYSPDNGYADPPAASKYTEEFLTRYRAAQLDRVRRLDAKARHLIAAADDAGSGPRARHRADWHMVIYRTAADPVFTDLTIEPDDRPIGTYSSGNPLAANYGTGGFARYVTPRAWLSTWSDFASRANTAACLRGIGTPTHIVHYAGDAGTRLSDIDLMVRCSAAADKSHHIVRGADHYGFRVIDGSRTQDRDEEGVNAVVRWLRERYA
jgi:hypothetical protein